MPRTTRRLRLAIRLLAALLLCPLAPPLPALEIALPTMEVYRTKRALQAGELLYRADLDVLRVERSSDFGKALLQERMTAAFVDERDLPRFLGRPLPVDLRGRQILLRRDLEAAPSYDPRAVNWAYPGSPYKVLNSDFIAISRLATFWLDQRRVLFAGAEGTKPLQQGDPPLKRKGLFIWDTVDNKVTKYRDGIHGDLCYRDGWLHYTLNPHPKLSYMAGPMGSEQRHDAGDYQQFWRDHIYSPVTCRFYPNSAYPVDLKRYKVFPLLDGMGYLLHSYGGKLPETPTRLISANGSPPVALPFTQFDAMADDLEFVRFRGAYFIPSRFHAIRAAWTAAGCADGWWLERDGSVQQSCIPAGPWAARGSSVPIVRPTAKGFFIAALGMRISAEKRGRGGAFLVDGDSAVPLIEGLVHAPSVSPDGCRVAFTHASDFEAAAYGAGRGKTSLMMVDLCN